MTTSEMNCVSGWPRCADWWGRICWCRNGWEAVSQTCSPDQARCNQTGRCTATSASVSHRFASLQNCTASYKICQTSLCSAVYVSWQRGPLLASAAVCHAVAQLLLSAERPPLSIDISCLHGTRQQTRRSTMRQANDGTDRQTERQTDARQFHRPSSASPHTMWSVSISGQSNLI